MLYGVQAALGRVCYVIIVLLVETYVVFIPPPLCIKRHALYPFSHIDPYMCKAPSGLPTEAEVNKVKPRVKLRL